MRIIVKKSTVLIMLMFFAIPAAFARDTGGAEPEAAAGNTIASVERPNPNGSISIYVETEAALKEIGRADFGIGFCSKSLPIPDWISGLAELPLRIEATAKGLSHIDSITIPGYRIAEGERYRRKLWAHDDDVTEIGSGISVLLIREKEAASPAGHGGAGNEAGIELVARIEPERMSTRPLRFPAANTYRGHPRRGAFYSYRIGSVPGSLRLNGDLVDEELGKPFFSAYVPNCSGHPQRNVLAWVRDDGENLFVAVDFLPDNTFDGDEDFAALYVDTPGGVKRFESNVNDTVWGVPGFTYTDKVPYQHKVYEFSIPFDEIGASAAPESGGATGGTGLPADGGRIRLSFEAYGTVYGGSGALITDVAYNSILNQYLIAYETYDFSSDEYIDVYAQIVDQAGNGVGSSHLIGEDLDLGEEAATYYIPDLSIAAAYSSASNSYLVVWMVDVDPIETGTTDIYGRLLDSDGSPIGGDIAICTAAEEQLEPDVAYDPVRDRFLVVWTDYRSGVTDDVYGQFVDAGGGLDGSNFAIADLDTAFSSGPALAFDNVNNRFMVVFVDNRSVDQYEVYGQIVDSGGSLVSTASDENFRILYRNTRDMNPPSIAFDTLNERFLVAVDDVGIDSVMAKLLDSNGSIIDIDGDLVPEEGEDYTELSVDEGINTEVAFCSTAGSAGIYQTVWQRDTLDVDDLELLEGCNLNTDASLSGLVVELAHNEDYRVGDQHPHLAANPYAGNFLMAYHEYHWNSQSYEVIALPIGAPYPNPGLAWPSGESDGVTPDSGPSGSTFTFEVEYTSAEDNAPSMYELWIDMDGNGVYAETAPLPPFSTGLRGNPLGGMRKTLLLSAGVIVIVALASVALRRKCAIRRVVFTCLAAGLALSACWLYEGKGTVTGGTLYDFSAPPERYTMAETDPGDTDYTDGKNYALEVAVYSSMPEVSYRFVFSDGTRDAQAFGASEMWFTVTQ